MGGNRGRQRGATLFPSAADLVPSASASLGEEEQGSVSRRCEEAEGAELSLAGEKVSRDCLDVLVCFWFWPRLQSHYLSKWSIDLCKAGSGRRG